MVNRSKYLKISLVISSVVLLGAILPFWPYGYYIMLRFLVCATAIYVILVIDDHILIKHVIPLGIIAILFNPLTPIHMSRATWLPIDLGIAVYFIVLVKLLHKNDVLEEKPTTENVNNYLNWVAAVYQHGDYELALKHFNQLSELDDIDRKIHITPYIERCKHVLNQKLNPIDSWHIKNQSILNKFAWTNRAKYFAGISGFIYLLALGPDEIEGATFWDNLSENPSVLFWSVGLIALSILIHFIMQKYKISENLIRCKYCGHYAINSKPFATDCDSCGRAQPRPDFNNDGWEGLAHGKTQDTFPDKEFYEKCERIKRKILWENKKKEEGINPAKEDQMQ